MLYRGCFTTEEDFTFDETGSTFPVSGEWSTTMGFHGNKLVAGQMAVITCVRLRLQSATDSAGCYFYLSTNDAGTSSICGRKFAPVSEDGCSALYMFDPPMPFMIDPRADWVLRVPETENTLYLTVIADTTGAPVSCYRAEVYWEQTDR